MGNLPLFEKDKTKHTAIFLVVLILNLATIGAPAAVMIRGLHSCGEWVTERQKPQFTIVRGALEIWLIGFLSGLAVATNTDVLNGTDIESLHVWMDNYCHDHPLDNLDYGSVELYRQLKIKKGL